MDTEYHDTEGGKVTTAIEAIAACGARIAELEAEKSGRAEILDSAWNTANERAIKAEAERDKWEWVATHYRGWDFSGPNVIGDRRQQSKRNDAEDEVEWLLSRWAERS